MATIGGEPGGRAVIVIEDKLGQDAAVPPQDDQTTAVPVGAPKPGQDVFAKDKQKGIKSQSLALDVPVVVNEKEISVVQAFQPTNATPEPVAGGKRSIKCTKAMRVAPLLVSREIRRILGSSKFWKGSRWMGIPMIFASLMGPLATRKPWQIRSRMSCIPRPGTPSHLICHLLQLISYL